MLQLFAPEYVPGATLTVSAMADVAATPYSRDAQAEAGAAPQPAVSEPEGERYIVDVVGHTGTAAGVVPRAHPEAAGMHPTVLVITGAIAAQISPLGTDTG